MDIVFSDPDRLAGSWSNFADAVDQEIPNQAILHTVEQYLEQRRHRHVGEFERLFLGTVH